MIKGAGSVPSSTTVQSHQYLTNVQWCYRRFGHETINLTSMNLLQTSCVITYAYLFLTVEVMEVVGGQNHPSEAKKGMKELLY